MGVNEADQLQEIIEKAKSWPVWSQSGTGGTAGSANIFAQAGQYGKSLRDIALWVALRESDRDQLVRYMQDWDKERLLRLDPLADRISQAFSDLLFGEDPRFTAADKSDQPQLDEIVESNDLPSELRRWASDCSSEGEIWWRIFVDRAISEFPIVEGHSRLDVVPLWLGRKLAAVAFVSDLYVQEIQLETQVQVVHWRHIEIQTEGMTRNLLYRGDSAGLGNQVELSQRPETEDLPEEWEHGLPVMLAGRVPNKLGRDWRLGISDYAGIRDMLFALNEARTIMAENARLTAKSRMVIPAAAVNEDGSVDLGKDVIVHETLDSVDSDKPGPYAVLEYNFQAIALIEYMDDLTTSALTRVGLAEQFVGSSSRGSVSGQASSGTALRTRLIPTTLAAAGKARYWDDAVPKMLQALVLVDSLPAERGGCAHSWRNPRDLPAMARGSVLPEDEGEQITTNAAAVAGEVRSVYSAVKALNPDWDESQIKAEIDRIEADHGGAALGGGSNPAPDDGQADGPQLDEESPTKEPSPSDGKDGPPSEG